MKNPVICISAKHVCLVEEEDLVFDKPFKAVVFTAGNGIRRGEYYLVKQGEVPVIFDISGIKVKEQISEELLKGNLLGIKTNRVISILGSAGSRLVDAGVLQKTKEEYSEHNFVTSLQYSSNFGGQKFSSLPESFEKK